MSRRAIDKSLQKRDAEPRIPKAVRHAVDLLLSGECKTVKAAAARANLSREHLSRMMAKDHVRAFIKRRSEENIADLVPRAVSVIAALMDGMSEHVKRDVAFRVLEAHGLALPRDNSPAINVNITPGYVIDLRNPDGSGPVIEGSAE